MLDRGMEIKLTEEQAETAKEEYRSRFSFLYELFDKRPFTLVSPTDQKVRVSAAVYDAAMVAMDNIWQRRDGLAADKDNIAKRMTEANSDAVKYEILVGRGNTADAVRDRINLMQRILLPS